MSTIETSSEPQRTRSQGNGPSPLVVAGVFIQRWRGWWGRDPVVRLSRRRAVRALGRIVDCQSLPDLWNCPPEIHGDIHAVLLHMPQPTVRMRRAIASVARRRNVTEAYVVDRAMTVRAVLNEVRQHDLYSMLDVHPSVTADELRRRWRELAKRYHPDRGEEDGLAFLRARAAYAILSDPAQRARYDSEWRRAHGPTLVTIAVQPRAVGWPSRAVRAARTRLRDVGARVAALPRPRVPGNLEAAIRFGAVAVVLALLWLGAHPRLDSSPPPSEPREFAAATPTVDPEPAARPTPAALPEVDGEVGSAPILAVMHEVAEAPAVAETPPQVAAIELPGPPAPLPQTPAAERVPAAVTAPKVDRTPVRPAKPRTPPAAQPVVAKATAQQPVAKPETPRTTPAMGAASPVDFSAARDFLVEFSRRYAAHEPLGLAELFTPSGNANGRHGVAIAEDYGTLFTRYRGTRYKTASFEVEPTNAGANVRSEFIITLPGRTPLHGHALWMLVREKGTVRAASVTQSVPSL